MNLTSKTTIQAHGVTFVVQGTVRTVHTHDAGERTYASGAAWVEGRDDLHCYAYNADLRDVTGDNEDQLFDWLKYYTRAARNAAEGRKGEQAAIPLCPDCRMEQVGNNGVVCLECELGPGGRAQQDEMAEHGIF